MFDEGEGEETEMFVSLQGQLTSEGVTDVLVIDCSDPQRDLTTNITLTHEGVRTLFPVLVGFLLREQTEEDLLAIVRSSAQHIRDQINQERNR